ncbi:DUF3592 domain-containing protein [Pseudomonas sp. OV226]|jgi:hypothetical protein|uniref:DUF3592 domain-containing protein n=1 Tax=Pseudomonas sp. OV226 TaxID=2135588 RepID=UPI000D6D0D47|nr:DUF3592 domain-containing protein [Pseudomonas sp. OV226]PWK39615.1 hypothetical protein C7534_11228 [Pseudomonas sp. OV226]
MFYPREAEKDHLYNRVILLTVACLVVLLLAGMARQEGMLYAAIQLVPIETTGTVTQLGDIRMNRDGKVIHYRYTDQDGQVHDDQYVDERYAQKTAFETGGSIPLIYSRWLPGQSSIARELNGNRPGFYIMMGGVLLTLLFLGISFRTLGRIARMKEEDRFY